MTDLHFDKVETAENSEVSEKGKAILHHIAGMSSAKIRKVIWENPEPYNCLLSLAEETLGIVHNVQGEYLGYAIQAIVQDTLVARMLKRLERFLEENDLPDKLSELDVQLVNRLFSEGWSSEDIFRYFMVSEQFSPDIEEEKSLAIMKKLEDKYRSVAC